MSVTTASATVSGSTCAARPTPGIYGDYQSYCPAGNEAYWHRVVVVCVGYNAAGRWVPSNQISRASCGQPRSYHVETWVGRPPGA
ncbi:hypothetical protein AB0P21_18345 [Kribbella sp. NPDC056861]|uniref:hypothetical protein n=1 Tax=Kribbella sp. NPDC056861 TaxID=3154857 RepID=UPI003438DC01